MDTFISKLRQDYPDVVFIASDKASWSAVSRQVTYVSLEHPTNKLATIHELGHAQLDHREYESDVDLLQKEVAAWKYASTIAQRYGLSIDDEHIQSCLDSYRDWLHRRSTCPLCEAHGLQRSRSLYGCFNCQTTWTVSRQRLCRPYRLKKA
jgi:hypothetical protein